MKTIKWQTSSHGGQYTRILKAEYNRKKVNGLVCYIIGVGMNWHIKFKSFNDKRLYFKFYDNLKGINTDTIVSYDYVNEKINRLAAADKQKKYGFNIFIIVTAIVITIINIRSGE